MVAKWPQWEFTQRTEFLRTDERCKVKRWTVKRWWTHSQESKTWGSENTTKKFQKETIKRIFDIHPVKHQSDSCTTGMDDNGDNGFHGIRTVEKDRSYFLHVLDTVDFLNILCLASSCGSCEAPPVIPHSRCLNHMQKCWRILPEWARTWTRLCSANSQETSH